LTVSRQEFQLVCLRHLEN